MADTKTPGVGERQTETNLSDALAELTGPAFVVHSLLQGAMSLLDEAEHLDNRCGDIFAARMLVSEAWEKVSEIYGDKETDLSRRLMAIDAVEVCHD